MEQQVLRDVLRNGGTATAGSNTTLTDTAVSWVVNSFVGAPIKILHGGIEYNTTIVSNTATVLTFVALPVGVVAASGDAYFFPFSVAASSLYSSLISYIGLTTAAGSALGTTLVCADLALKPSLDGQLVKILSGAAKDQVRAIEVHNGNTLIVGVAFTNVAGAVQQILIGTSFAVISIIGGGGGPGPAPSEGLVYYGVVDAIAANQFTIGSLAGLGIGKFDGVNNPYFAFVLRTALGTGLAPQGEQQAITAYANATGTFTTTAFTVAVAVGDEILIVSPYLAAMGMLYAEHSGALAYLGQCPTGMAPSTNVINCPGLAYLPAQTFTRGYQMIVLRNANAVANPPEMEMRAITNFGAGIFATAAFSANVEELDVVLIIHNSVAAQISAYGIADAGSGVGIVRDSARTEADDWWNGQTVMMMSGAARGQKRPIADFIAATDDIIPAPNFDAAVAAGDLYVILAHYNPIVPRTADDAANALASDVIGRKDDTATPDDMSLLATSSLVRDLKRVLLRIAPAALSVVSQPGVAARTDIGAILTDLADILAGGTGITNFPAGAAAANGVSMAEVLRYIQETLVAPTAVGSLQIKARTIDVQQAANTYDLFTATTQDVVVEKLVIRFSGGAVGGTVTSISIQTDDATPQVIIPVTLVAVLTNEAQLAWTGAILLDAGTSAKIRLTIAGGAAGAANLADVIAEYRAVVAGGYLT